MKKVRIILVLMVILLLPLDVQAASKVKLSSSNKTVQVGKTVKISVKNNKKKVKWSVSNGKIKIVKKTNKYVKVKAVKAGTAVLRAKIGKRTYKCNFTVKKKTVKEDDSSKYCGFFTDQWKADYLEILSYENGKYTAIWGAWRIGAYEVTGVKTGNKIRFTDAAAELVIDAEFDGYDKVEVTVTESKNQLISVGRKKSMKRGSSFF